MTITQIDHILAAYHRAKNLGTIPQAKLCAAVAQSLGISVEMVQEALESEGVEA